MTLTSVSPRSGLVSLACADYPASSLYRRVPSVDGGFLVVYHFEINNSKTYNLSVTLTGEHRVLLRVNIMMADRHTQ